MKAYDVITKTLKKGVAAAAFAAATAFFWGGTEAVTNYLWRPAGTWWGTPLWESAFRRLLFYAFVVLAVAAIVLVITTLLHILRKKGTAGGERRGWPGAFALAAVVASNLGWFIAGLHRQGNIHFWFVHEDLREPGPFFVFWAIFITLALAAAVILALFVTRRRWWRIAGKFVRAAGVVGFAAVVVFRYAAPALQPVPRKPNIVLIILDAWRADAFRDSLMPNLAAYAEKNATVYRRTWSCSSWTYPSMVSMFTGQYPDASPLWKPPQKWTAPTVAQLLRDAGYETAAFVANPCLKYYSPVAIGFSHFVFWDWNPFLRALRYYDTNWNCPAIRETFLTRRPYDTDHSRVLSRLSADYLSRPRRRPIFMWVHYMDPHAPYAPPPGYYLRRDERFIYEYCKRTKPRRFAHHRLYEAECAFLDDLLPYLLEKTARHENTVVIITSDHGEEFWEHKTYGHGKSVYETVTRVPLIISVPGNAPSVVETPTSLVDLAPTILEFAGVDVPTTINGKPLSGAPRGDSAELIFIGSRFSLRPDYMPKRQDAVVLWPWKLLLFHGRMAAPGEYYNLRNDPGERTPLEEDKLARELRKKLKAWKRMAWKKGRDSDSPFDAVDAADLKALGYI